MTQQAQVVCLHKNGWVVGFFVMELLRVANCMKNFETYFISPILSQRVNALPFSALEKPQWNNNGMKENVQDKIFIFCVLLF